MFQMPIILIFCYLNSAKIAFDTLRAGGFVRIQLLCGVDVTTKSATFLFFILLLVFDLKHPGCKCQLFCLVSDFLGQFLLRASFRIIDRNLV